MLMNKYVILPSIRYIKISNFNLYKNNEFEWNFDRNFNLFLGINGLGKSTTLSLIAYALVGLIDKNEKDDDDKRISKNEIGEFTEISEYGISDKKFFKRYDQQKNSQVYLEFSLGANKFKLTRDMLNHSIKSICINEMDVQGDLDKEYTNIFEKYSGISIQNFIRIFYTLLIRYEEAPSLLFRPRTQHTALRTLFFDNSFHEEFLNAERKYRSLNGDFRRLTDNLRDKREKIIDNIKSCRVKSEELGEYDKNGGHWNDEITKLELRKTDLEKKIFNIEEQIKSVEEHLDKLNNQHNDLIRRKDGIGYDKELLDEEINNLQKNMYAYIYSDNSVYNLAINSARYNDCIFCGSKISKEKVEKLISTINSNSCPFCHTSINGYQNNKRIDKAELEKQLEKRNYLNKQYKEISKELEEVNSTISSNKSRYESLYKELIDTRKLQVSYDKELDGLYKKKNSTQFVLLENELKKANLLTDALIKEFEEDSLKIYGYKVDYNIFESAVDARKGIGGIDKELDSAKTYFNNLLEQSTYGVKEFESKIIEKFNKYNILNNEFTLEVRESDNIEHNIPYKYNIFVPVGVDRDGYEVRDKSSKLSKSQQIVLDYAFRMALVEHYCEITNNKDILIAFETSEGVFDFRNVEKFADTLKKYSLNNKILLISNLSNADYLKSILSIELPDSEKYIKNFIDVSGKKNIDRDFFVKKFEELFEGVK